jgi:GTP-binding protein YchF
VHVNGEVDPISDKEIIDTELQLKDLETIEKRIAGLEKEGKRGDKSVLRKKELVEHIRSVIEQGQNARAIEFDEQESELIKDMHLLTAKPVLYVCNVDEASVRNGNEYVEQVKEMAAKENAEVLVIGAAIEADISELETYEERQLFLEDLQLDEPGVNKLIRAAYKILNLQTYFTAGKKEVRAWTIPVGASAPQAAGVIHTDFEKGFIRAEVIKYNDYVELGSELACKDKGKMSIEGKEYVVMDGDVMHFRFNV